MRILLSIVTALLATACERGPEAVSMPAADATARPSVAFAPSAVSGGSSTAPAPSMPAANALTDSAITGRVRNALVGDPGMAGADVSVNTDNGVVVLEGTVKSQEQTAIASAHAQRQDGVLRVDNHLRPVLS